MVSREYIAVLNDRLAPALFRPVPTRILWLPVHGSVVAACSAVIVNIHIPLLAKLALSVVIGLSYTCLGILGHEVLHGSVVEPLWVRRLLGGCCLALLAIGPVFWTIWHNIHHANTQHPDRDPDTWGTSDSAPLDPAMKFLRRFAYPRTLLFPFLLATGVTAHAAALLFFTQPRMTPRQRAVTMAEFLGLWCFWLGLGWWLGWTNFVFFFVMPLLVSNFIVNSFVVTNHFLSPLDDDSGDPLAGSLTVSTYRWVEWLLLNFNYHTEHHLFPRMNPKHAPQVAQLLREIWPDRYHELPHGRALLAVWRTPRLYYDRVQLIDTRNQTLYGTLGHGLDVKEMPSGRTSGQKRASEN